MSPERAREIAQGLMEIVRRGGDPAADRRALRDQARASETFAEAVDDYIAREQIGRRGNATAPEVKRNLLRECAACRARPVREIGAVEIRRLVEAIRDGSETRRQQRPRPYLANRTFAHLRTFFAWCAEPGIGKVDISPMLGLRRPWEGEEARDRVFDDDELRALWRAADALSADETARTGRSAGAFLKLIILTGKRRGALSAMLWEEIDEHAGVWAPRSETRRRRRNKRLHPVPLPPLAIRIIQGLPRKEGNPYVFAGRRRDGHIDPGSPLAAEIRERSGIDDFFFHAARHTVETRLAELRVPPHIRDLLLDHAPARGAGAGYDHHHYRDEMREALKAWASHVERLVVTERGVRVLR